jgi:hypothetical protein
MREVLEPVLKVALPARAGVDAGLGLPVFFITVQSFRPISSRVGSWVDDGRIRGRRDVSAFKRQDGIRRERGNGWWWCNEALNFFCVWWDH